MNVTKAKASFLGKSANILIWLFLIMACVFVVTPLLFMFSASFMPAIDIMKLPYPWVSDHVHWQNYWNGLRGPGRILHIPPQYPKFPHCGSCGYRNYSGVVFIMRVWTGQVQIQRTQCSVHADHGNNDDSL